MSEPRSLDERRALLAQVLQTQLVPGTRIESQTDTQVVLVFGRRPNHILHFLIGFLTCGVWWVVWLILAMTQNERRRLLTVDEYGNVASRDY